MTLISDIQQMDSTTAIGMDECENPIDSILSALGMWKPASPENQSIEYFQARGIQVLNVVEARYLQIGNNNTMVINRKDYHKASRDITHTNSISPYAFREVSFCLTI